MSAVLDEKGARILPTVADERAMVTAWAATQCANADHRTKHAVYAELASKLVVIRGASDVVANQNYVGASCDEQLDGIGTALVHARIDQSGADGAASDVAYSGRGGISDGVGREVVPAPEVLDGFCGHGINLRAVAPLVTPSPAVQR